MHSDSTICLSDSTHPHRLTDPSTDRNTRVLFSKRLSYPKESKDKQRHREISDCKHQYYLNVVCFILLSFTPSLAHSSPGSAPSCLHSLLFILFPFYLPLNSTSRAFGHDSGGQETVSCAKAQKMLMG